MTEPKVVCGLLTWNHRATGREQMFWDTLNSLADGDYPCEIITVTNGATEQATIDAVRALGGIVDETDGIWYGMTLAIEECVRRGADLVVFSADDGLYAKGWLRKLVAFWRDMPAEVKIVCPTLNGVWPWNMPRGYIEGGGLRGLVRDSVPGSFWTFRAEDWPLIKELMPQSSPGEDLAVSQALNDMGYMLVEVELCSHVGAFRSAWGNRSEEWVAPLDRERWGV